MCDMQAATFPPSPKKPSYNVCILFGRVMQVVLLG